MIKRFSLFFFIIILTAVCTSKSYVYELEVSETRVWPAAGVIQLSASNVNGSITVSAVQETTITAEITKKCRGEDKDDAEEHIDNIVINEDISDGTLILEADMPHNDENRNYRADFDITIPEFIYLDLATVNGRISITDMVAGAKVRITNGEIITRNLQGGIDGVTVNGEIDSDLALLAAAKSAFLTTTNGDVMLSLPADVSASFDASTVNGEVTVTGFTSVDYTTNLPTHKAGTIGSGDATITITVTNGNITIRAR